MAVTAKAKSTVEQREKLTISQLQKKLILAKAEVKSSKAKSKKFLEKTGIYTKSGTLSSHYK
jgi:hypothetical protein